MKPRTLAADVGQALRAFREARSLQQDEVARSARQAGLPWTRVVVRALEGGRRELSIDEFARLAVVLEHMGARGATVELEAGTDVARIRVHDLLQQRYPIDRGPETGILTEPVALCRRVWPGVRVMDVEAAYAAAGRDLEQRVGRQVRLQPVIVALAARRAWGRGLTEERDHRIGGQVPHGTEPRVIQALRGHVTRALLAELEPQLAEARRRLRGRR